MEMMEQLTVGEINKYINVFYGKNREVWVRGGGPGPEYEDCSLWDFIRRIAPSHGVQVEQENEELDWQMCDMLADGAETKEGLIAFFMLRLFRPQRCGNACGWSRKSCAETRMNLTLTACRR